ncbi:MAG TPA: HAMP domain-containing sensor histidine kinase [Streptosporangiaceae bacterium]
MTDKRTGISRRAIVRTSLTLQLAIAFVIISLAAVAMLSLLTAVMGSSDIESQDTMRREAVTANLAALAGGAFQANHGFTHADLGPASDLGIRTGTGVMVKDDAGRVVAQTPGFAKLSPKPEFTAPIRVNGVDVGQVVTRFSGNSAIGTTGRALRTSLLRAIGGAAGLAALLALIAGVIAARIITGPLLQMIATVRSRGAGVRGARVGPVRAPGEIAELAAAFDEMADSTDRQEQLRRDLVADVAHELRTPVAVLQAGHEALLDGVAEPTPEELGSLRDEVLRLARMVSDLQDMAAAEAAALHLQLVPCDLAEMAVEAADSMAGRFDAAGLAFERQVKPVTVRADPRWLPHVIMNLLTNALKYTPAGGTVTLDCGPVPDGARAVLTVTDTGIGISRDELPHIFERFWRSQHVLRTSGSGIGLAIVREMVQAHDGELRATSQEGQGTTMTMTLPRA